MEKTELISYLHSYQGVTDDRNETKAKLDRDRKHLEELKVKPEVKYHTKEEPLKRNVFDIIFLMAIYSGLLMIPVMIILLIVSLIFPHLIDSLYQMTGWVFFDQHPFLTYLIFGLMVSIPCSYPITIASLKDGRKTDIAKWSRYQKGLKEIPALQESITMGETKLEKLGRQKQELTAKEIVPTKYLSYSSNLLDYLETGRADTLKEAINLLEVELRENERDRELWAHHQAMQKQAAAQTDILYGVQEETTRAANAAESSAAWSAVGTILTASEIDRQRKKDKNGL